MNQDIRDLWAITRQAGLQTPVIAYQFISLLAGCLFVGSAWGNPPPPTNLTAVVKSPTSVTVTLYTPASGASDINSYTVTSNPDNQTCSPPLNKNNSQPISCTVIHLNPGTPYTFSATATSDGGTSLPSIPSSSVTPDYNKPPPPTNPTALPGNKAVQISFYSPTNDGNNGEAPIIAYNVTASPDNKSCTAPPTNAYGQQTSCIVNGLTNDVQYTFTLSSVNKKFTSTNNPTIKSKPTSSIPPAPSNVQGLASNGQALISWDAVDWVGNHIDSYEVIDTNTKNIACETAAPTTTTQPPTQCVVPMPTKPNLTNDKTYSFYVQATSGKTTSLPSDTVSVKPTDKVPLAPSAPTATADNAKVTVNWTAPAGGSITGYRVQAYRVDNEKGDTPVAVGKPCSPSPATTTSCTFKVGDGTLSTGLYYKFTVRAESAAGYSLESDSSNVVQTWGTTTFNLQGNDKLPKDFQVYVTGFSTAGPLVLQKDGTWSKPDSETGVLPCYRYPQDISSITINSQQTEISARVYFFVANIKSFPTECNPTASKTGLFNLPNVFTYTEGGAKVKTPDANLVTSGKIPAWTFSEIGASTTSATLDLSQVDFFAFPMNAAATVLPGNPSLIGNPVTNDDNPGNAINSATIFQNYNQYFDNIAKKANNGLGCQQEQEHKPIACAFLDLLQTIPNSPGSPQIIQNPGGFLGMMDDKGNQINVHSKLNTLFDGVITDLWSGTQGPLAIDSGGYLGGTDATNGVNQDVFTSSTLKLPYPGSNPPYLVKALKFTGGDKSKQYVAYVFDPADVSDGCKLNKISSSRSICGAANLGSGYQVFAGAGTLDTPSCEDYDALFNKTLDCKGIDNGSVPKPVELINYQAVVGRLGLLISAALNRGVGEIQCPSPKLTWQCWQDETKWYPSDPTNAYQSNAVVQNLFSQWIHTAQISGVPIFQQPPGPVKSAGGNPMGMAYGFAADENPTPQVDPNNPQPEVPSKLDQTITYGVTTNTITFGAWESSLSVTTAGQGTVASSPAGIDCGTKCVQTFAAGETVQLTATPATGYVFSGWTGNCRGTSTICKVITLGSPQAVKATFTAVPAGHYGLTARVTGSGSVTSSPTGINCTATSGSCSIPEPANSVITLTAVPAKGASFTGWSGACSGTALNCQVTMSQAQTVQANFGTSSQYTLSVTPHAGGTVTTQPGGIDCGTVCQASFNVGAQVSVFAQPAPGYVFSGWSGACTGTQTCDLIMNANHTLTPQFNPTPPQTFSLTVQDVGSGAVTSSPAGINCGTLCSSAFATDSEVTLTAVPENGYQFSGWSGACAGNSACVVRMEKTMAVKATFVPTSLATYSVSGSVAIPGSRGTVTLALTPNTGNTGTPTQSVIQTLPSGSFIFDNLDNGQYTLSVIGLSKQKLWCTFGNQSLTAPPITLAGSGSSGNDVNCVTGTQGYSVGGTVSGLDPNKSVTLRNNEGKNQGGSTLSVSNPGPQQFLFANQVANTSGYAVTVKSNPPGQTCQVAQNGQGSAASHPNNLTVGVVCQKKPAAFSVGGKVNGLPVGQTISLLDNGTDSLNVNGAGNGSTGVAFTFGTEIATGGAYNVTIKQAPNGYQCVVTNGSGSVTGNDVTSVMVDCTDDPSTFSISGNVKGLTAGQTVTVSAGNYPPQLLTPSNTQYAFTGWAAGSSYSLKSNSTEAACRFDGPDSPSGTVTRNLDVNLVCLTPTQTHTLSVQNTGSPFLLLQKHQAAVVQLNGGRTAAVWGGATGPTSLGSLSTGSDFNVWAIGQSKGEWCNAFTPASGTLVADTTAAFQCTNVGPGAYPGECAGLYSDTNNQPMPPQSLAVLCARGETSGAVQLTDGRWQWRCSGSGNPKVINAGTANAQWQGTATCYTTSYAQPDPGKQNQDPLWISASNWTIIAGGSQTFTIEGGSGTGDLNAPSVESVGHAVCSVQTRVKGPGYRVVAQKSQGTNGNGACVIWAGKRGDANFYDVAASPTIFNVKTQ